MTNFKISIILATYNWPDALSLVLASLVPQLLNNPDAELLIADDGSSDTTRQIINQYQIQCDRIQHIWHEDQGFRKSIILNKAVAQSCGEYLIFLDGDCIPFPDYIQQHLALAEPGYMVSGERILCTKSFTISLLQHPDLVQTLQQWNISDWLCARFCKKVNKFLAIIRLSTAKTRLWHKWRYFSRYKWQIPKGCNFAVYRDDFYMVNGFDESFHGWGHEDADLFVRLLHAGIHIKSGRYAIPVIHLWHKLYDRSNEQSNFTQLMQRVNDTALIEATAGVRQYGFSAEG